MNFENFPQEGGGGEGEGWGGATKKKKIHTESKGYCFDFTNMLKIDLTKKMVL